VLFCRGSWNISYAAVHCFLQGDKVEIDIYNIRMLHFEDKNLILINLPKIGDISLYAKIESILVFFNIFVATLRMKFENAFFQVLCGLFLR
jgi:hypothetical protein